MLKALAAGIIGLGAFIGGLFGGYQPAPQTPLAGSYSPTGGGTYRLGQSIGTSDTTIRLSSFKEPVSGILYTMSYLNSDIEYVTLSPQSSISEFASFSGITQNSDGSATLTGVVRGLSRTPGTGGCVASTTLAQSHAGQSILILSNPPCQLAEYATLRDNQTFSGTNTYGSTTPPKYDADPVWGNFSTQIFADVAYVNSVVAAGAANASETVKGIVQLATAAQAALGTSLGSTAARLAIPNSLATSTPYNSGSNVVPVTGTNEKLSQAFLDLTQWFNFSQIFATAASSTNATTTNQLSVTSGRLSANNIYYMFPGTQGASSTALETNGSGALSWEVPQVSISSINTTLVQNSANSTTTIASYTIPANTLAVNKELKVDTFWSNSSLGSQCAIEVDYGNGTATTSVGYTNVAGTTLPGEIQVDILATTTSSEATVGKGYGNNGSTQLFSILENSPAVNVTATSFLGFAVIGGGSNACRVNGYSVQVLSN